MTSRAWLLTIYYVETVPIDEAKAASLFDWSANQKRTLRFGVGQLERCPDTDRIHLQSYWQLRCPVRFTGLAALLGLLAGDYHADKPVTSDEARDYCQKEDTRIAGPWQAGVYVTQGKSADLATAVAQVVSGAPLRAIATDDPLVVVRHFRGLQVLADLLHPPTNDFNVREVHVRTGAPGTGKTKWAYDAYPTLVRAPVAGRPPWFDGICRHTETVLFDDYAFPSVYDMPLLLQLLDGYPLRVPVKGGFTTWQPKVVLITSNFPYTEWYPTATPQFLGALRRRITSDIEML